MTAWKVVTENSTYVLDLDRMTALRLNGDWLSTVEEEDEGRELTVPLRMDGTPIPLLVAPLVQVGKPVELVLRIRPDGVPTYRLTTPVRELTPLTAHGY